MVDRLINTSEKRGIDETKYIKNDEQPEMEELEDELEPIEKTTPEELTKQIDTKELHKDEEQEYLMKALNESDPNLIAWVKYNAIGLKQKEGKKLTKNEKLYLKDMKALYDLEQQKANKETAKEADNEEKKEEVMQEYNKTKELNPQKIDSVIVNDTKQTLRGGDSLPKVLKFAFLMKKAKKKGGKILVKVTRDRRVLLEWTNKELSFVEFWVIDEKGNNIPEVTRFSEYKYNYEGSPIPVLFAIQGYAEGYDFFDNLGKDITSEMVSRIASRARHAGFLEGVRLQDKQAKKGLFDSLPLPVLMIAIIGMCIVMIYFLYMMYDDMTTMRLMIESLKTAAQTGAIVVGR